MRGGGPHRTMHGHRVFGCGPPPRNMMPLLLQNKMPDLYVLGNASDWTCGEHYHIQKCFLTCELELEI
jgi:hypothetical protein